MALTLTLSQREREPWGLPSPKRRGDLGVCPLPEEERTLVLVLSRREKGTWVSSSPPHWRRSDLAASPGLTGRWPGHATWAVPAKGPDCPALPPVPLRFGRGAFRKPLKRKRNVASSLTRPAAATKRRASPPATRRKPNVASSPSDPAHATPPLPPPQTGTSPFSPQTNACPITKRFLVAISSPFARPMRFFPSPGVYAWDPRARETPPFPPPP